MKIGHLEPMMALKVEIILFICVGLSTESDHSVTAQINSGIFHKYAYLHLYGNGFVTSITFKLWQGLTHTHTQNEQPQICNINIKKRKVDKGK